ncbi:MAG: DUF6531 domain-containing protein [Candidatus Omnitrophota bacterium]
MQQLIKKFKSVSFVIIFTFILNTISLYLPTNAMAWHYPYDQGHKTTQPEEPEKTTPPPDPCTLTGSPVHLNVGNYFTSHQDLYIPCQGLSIDITRTYNSQDKYNGAIGHGWNFTYNLRLYRVEEGGGEYYIIIRRGDGVRYRFTENADGTYTPPAGRHDRLTKTADEEYLFTTLAGIKYHYAYGILADITDSNNNKMNFTYTAEGRLLNITDPAGRKLEFSYGANGRISQITDPIGRIIKYNYDANGNLTEVTDPAGNTTTYTYNSDHRLTSIIDAKGTTIVSLTYSEVDKVTSYTEHGLTESMTYYPASKYTRVLNHATSYSTYHYYNETGNLIKKQDEFSRWTYNTWDEDINLTSTKDARGNTTNYTYDENGNMLTQTGPDGNVTTFTYHPTHNKVTTVTDAKGNTTTYAYDTKGNLTKITDALGNTTQYTYDSFGNLKTLTDANGNMTTYTYDNYGNLTKITDALENETSYGYDLAGRRISSTDANGNTAQYCYALSSDSSSCGCDSASGASDKITKIIYPDNTTEEFEYDPCGNLTKKTDANGNETLYDYDNFGRLIKVSDALSNITEYTYDTSGNLETIKDANSNITTYTYDRVNRVSKITDALGYSTEYSYDSVGNLIKKTDANSQITEYEYDKVNKLTKVYYGGKTAPIKTVEFTYDAVGNMLAWNTSTAQSAGFTYDALNRVTQVSTTYPFGTKTVSYTYDKVGNRKTLTYPDGIGTVNYTYDALNRLISIDHGPLTVDYKYDPAGRLKKKTLPNGVYTDYDYDSLNRLVSLFNKNSAGAVISSFAYTHDNSGNRLSMVTTEGTHDYTYDDIYRLRNTTHPATPTEVYTYDSVGNRLNSADYPTWVYDSSNRLISYNGTSFSYDNNGNTITKTAGTDVTNYTYDYENRLVSVTDTSTALSASYDYCPFGKRIKKEVTQYSIPNTQYFLYDNEDIIAEYNDTGSLTSYYVHGQGIDEPISLTTYPLPLTTYYYTFDGLGSVSELTDETEQVVEKYRYDAFGNLTIRDAADMEIPESAIGNPYAYTSREYDIETGLYFYRARYYDAITGRFLSKDPLLEMRASSKNGWLSCSIGAMTSNGVDNTTLVSNQNLHPYLYVSNNPINVNDPSGKEACTLILTPTLLLPPAWIICAILGTVVIGGVIYYKLSVRKNKKGRMCRCTIRYLDDCRRKEWGCPDRVYAYGDGINLGACQKVAKQTAPAKCRAYYGHCGWVW